MMRRARRVHAIHGLFLAIGLVIGGVAGLLVANDRGMQHANEKIDTLLKADIKAVPGCINDLAKYRRWADPLLWTAFQKGEYEHEESTARIEPGESLASDASRIQLHAAMALLPAHSGQLDKEKVIDFLLARLLDCDLTTLPIIRDQLFDHRHEINERLWGVLKDQNAPTTKRFNAACALAKYSSEGGNRDEPRWDRQSAFVAESMVDAAATNIGEFDSLVEVFKTVKAQMIDPLIRIFRDPQRTESRLVTAAILARYATDVPETLAEVIVEAEPRSFEVMFNVLKADSEAANLMIVQLGPLMPTSPAKLSDDFGAAKRAIAAVALLRLGEQDRVWPLLASNPDPLVRSQIIHRASLYSVPAETFIKRLTDERDVSIRRALILALGEFDGTMLSSSVRRALIGRLSTLCREDADPGIHGAAEWLLRKWDRDDQMLDIGERLNQSDNELRSAEPRDDRRWYVNYEGQTMAVIPSGEFQMGSPRSEPDREGYEDQHPVLIKHSFAIATHEVTNGEFRRFPGHAAREERLAEWVNQHLIAQDQCDDPLRPSVGVSWYEATEYCNWLSQQDGIPEDQWSYEPNQDKKYAEGMKLYPSRTGYRLPTEAEWEYACRAGTVTSRYFGQGDDLLPEYAWFSANSSSSTQPVGTKKPNDFGLFDMLGNALEWCHDGITAGTAEILPEDSEVKNSSLRVMRGAMYRNLARHVRAARRLDRGTTRRPDERDFIFGFRPVRTLP
jgi:formylglycine-generating enzyme required for sulfatase activity